MSNIDLTKDLLNIDSLDLKLLVFNSIPEQHMTYANQLTLREWNNIVNMLRVQTNNTTIYLKQLHSWITAGSTSLKQIVQENRDTVQDHENRLVSIESDINKYVISNIYDEVNEGNPTSISVTTLDGEDTYTFDSNISSSYTYDEPTSDPIIFDN